MWVTLAGDAAVLAGAVLFCARVLLPVLSIFRREALEGSLSMFTVCFPDKPEDSIGVAQNNLKIYCALSRKNRPLQRNLQLVRAGDAGANDFT